MYTPIPRLYTRGGPSRGPFFQAEHPPGEIATTVVLRYRNPA